MRIQLKGRLKVNVLEAVFGEIIRRHEVLRTRFIGVEGHGRQVIEPVMRCPISIVDLEEVSEEQQSEVARRVAVEEVERPFDLQKGPLLRLSLHRLKENEHIGLMTIHHIVSDRWSMEILMREVAVLYNAMLEGKPSPLRELQIQYADYAVWQREWLQGETLERQLKYWREQLKGPLPNVSLPTDRPAGGRRSYRGGQYVFHVGEDTSRRLAQLNRHEGVTMFMSLLAAFKTLLYRYSGQEDIVVGIDAANRGTPESETLVGFFVNQLVIRIALQKDLSFRGLLRRVREVTLEAYGHRDLPFEKLVDELKPERSLSRYPLYEIGFSFQNSPAATVRMQDLELTAMVNEAAAAKVDLVLFMQQTEEGLTGSFNFSLDVFDPTTIARMAGHFRELLKCAADEPDRRISDLDIVPEDESHALAIEWNDKPVSDQSLILHELFEASVRLRQDAIAVVCGEEQITYGELNSRATQLANLLAHRGVGADTIVAVVTERCHDMIIALLGTLKSGGSYLPIDPATPKQRLAFMLEDAKPAVILTAERFFGLFETINIPKISIDTVWSRGQELDQLSSPLAAVSDSNLCYIIYTSGTTGLPKAVMVEHRSVSEHLLWMQRTFPLFTTDTIPQKYSFTFDASVWEIFGPLIAGARLAIVSSSGHLDIDALISVIDRYQATVIDLVPSLLQALLADSKFLACASLRRITCGGEQLTLELQNLCLANVNVELNNIYGPTEATIGALAWTCRPENCNRVVPIGRPASTASVYLMDAHGNLCPIGVAGEIYIGGDCLARGYLNRADVTAERFLPDQFSVRLDGGRLYRTGDLGRYLPDGNIEYLGRVDRQVKIRGYRIELDEIEAALQRHSGVDNCTVDMRPDKNGRPKLAAYVVPRSQPPELWPSLGEYAVYDDVLYYAMTHDESRSAAYRAAIQEVVPGKVVVDIGTGADALLARICTEAGAKHVYAIEMLDESYQKARSLIDSLGLRRKITLIPGNSTDVELPELVDVCVFEILGTIGSSEGVVPVINDAGRFLKKDGRFIPSSCMTRIAAVSLPDGLAQRPRFSKWPAEYAQRVFERFGYPFDLRLCIRNMPRNCIVSNSGVFEHLDFSRPMKAEDCQRVILRITRRASVDGLLLWLNLYPHNGQLIDVLETETNWLPVFFPCFSPALQLEEGDVIEADCFRLQGEDPLMPDYRISGGVRKRNGASIQFVYDSRYREKSFGGPFFDLLFGAGRERYHGREKHRSHQGLGAAEQPGGAGANDLIADMRFFLEQCLPEYMVPVHFIMLDKMPLTSSGKVDRRALHTREVTLSQDRRESALCLAMQRRSCWQAYGATY